MCGCASLTILTFFTERPRYKQAWPRCPKAVRASTGRPPTLMHLALDASPAQRLDASAVQRRPADWQRFLISFSRPYRK